MRPALRRWWAPVLGVASFIAVLWFTPGLWIRLDGWVQNQRDRVWEKLETLVGQKIVYDRIAPNVLAALDFQNVRLLADDGTPVLTAASIRLSLDWGLVLQGRLAEALRRVQVINATVNLDQRRDRALIDHWASFLQPSGTTAFGYEVDGFNLTARWTDGVRLVTLSRGFVVLTPREGLWGLRFRGALAWDDRSAGRSWANLAVRGDLRSDAAFQNWSLRTEASSVRTSWFDLEPVALQVTVSPDEVTVAKVADRIPLDLQAVWNRSTDLWTVRGAAEGFRPSRWIHVKGLAAWAGFADGTVTGRFTFRSTGDFAFDGHGDWPAGSWPAPFDQDAVSAGGSVRTEGGAYRFEGFHLDAPFLALDFDGSLDRRLRFPEGTLRLERYIVPGAGEAQGTLVLSRESNRIVFSGQGVKWNDLGSDGVSGWIEQAGGAWNFQLEGPVDGTVRGRVSAAGFVDPRTPRFDARVQVANLPLRAIRSELHRQWPGGRIPDQILPFVADADARVQWSPSGLEVSDATLSLADPGSPARALQATGSWKDQDLELAVQSVQWDGFQASGAASMRFQADGAMDWSLSGAAWNRHLQLVGRWVPSDRTVAFSGSPGIAGTVHENDAGVWTADVTLDPLEIVPGWTVGFHAQAAFGAEEWTLAADQVTVAGVYPWDQTPFRVTGRLSADPWFFRWSDLAFTDAHGRLTGAALSSWSADWSEPWAGRVSLAGAEPSQENLVLDWVATASDHWHWGLRASGLDLSRLPQKAVQGRLAVSGSADWTGASVNWNAQTTLSAARWGDSPLGFRAAWAGSDLKVSLRNASVSVNSVRIQDGSVDLDAGARRWSSSLGVGVRFGNGEWVSRWISSGTWSPPSQPGRTEFSLRTQGNTWAGKSFGDSVLKGHWADDGWGARLGDGELTVEGTPDGSFRLKAQAPFPVQADAQGTWSGSRFAVAVQGFRADLGLVKGFVNSPLFSVSQGQASGDLALTGSPTDPEVNGMLTVHGLVMQSSFVRRALGPIDVPVVFEGHQVRVDPVNVGPEGQTWMVSGAARLDHLVPEEFQFALQTDALSVLPISYQYTGIAAVGGVSGLLVVKGGPLAVTLGGRLILQDTTITLKQTPVGPATGLGFNADLTLVTGRKVEFLWPNETLPLLRAVTASNQVLSIRANDVASTWSVTGKLAVKTGEINYLNRTFVIREGQLGFQENQSGFDPRFSVRAEYKVRETTGDVVVNLRADGTFNHFSPRFDAVPYQSPEDLQRLIGSTLALPSDYSKATSVDTALSLASDVGTSFLLTPFEETVKKNFQLDLFTVKTEILKKSLLNRNGPVEASDYLDNTRLFFGKYIGDDLFLQGTLAFRRDGSVATQASPKMVVEPEFQMEFQTPFFLLNWTLLPLHPETLFVTDNTVTFRWNWSY